MMKRLNPTLEGYLPALMYFVKRLSENYQNGKISSWEHMVMEVDSFFAHQDQEQFERALPGWREMTSYAGGITQAHTIAVLVAILISPAYQNASEELKNQMEWSGLLHDISKRVVKGQPDLTHAFRSGAPAARILIQAGFWYKDVADMDSWTRFTSNAIRDDNGRRIQDNTKLPEIMAGLEAIFGENHAALNIMKAIIFHWSFTTIKEWPCAAPLTATEVRAYLDDETIKVLEPLIQADSDSWNLFDHGTKERYQAEIAESLGEIRLLLETSSPN